MQVGLCQMAVAALYAADLTLSHSFQSTRYRARLPPRRQIAANAGFAFLVTSLLPGAAAAVFFVTTALFHVFAWTYFAYFEVALSLKTMKGQVREGMQAAKSLGSLLPKREVGWLVASLFLKEAAIVRGEPLVKVPDGLVVCLQAAAFLAIVLSFHRSRNHSLKNLRTWCGVADLIPYFGDVIPRVAEVIYCKPAHLVAKTMSQTSSGRRFTLGEVASAPVVVVQWESLDADFLAVEVRGRKVMPFFASLAERGLSTKVPAVHLAGSADADFCVLSGHMPPGAIVPYKIDGMPFESFASVPRAFLAAGEKAASYHGVSGGFFLRREPFRRLGFNRIWFREELERSGFVARDHWGIRDPELLTFVSDQVRSNPAGLHFVITVTTHHPFDLLLPEERLFFPDARDPADRFVDAMAFVDRQAIDFVARLPLGTTVVFYGDHGSGIDLTRYLRGPATGDVPLAIFRKDDSGLVSVPGVDFNEPEWKLQDVHAFLKQTAEAMRDGLPGTGAAENRRYGG